jgi:hypothetical protein
MDIWSVFIFLAIVSNAMDIHVQSFCRHTFILLEIVSECEIAIRWWLCVNILRSQQTFPETAPVYNSSSNYEVSNFSTYSPVLVIISPLDYNHSIGYEVVCHGGFDFHFLIVVRLSIFTIYIYLFNLFGGPGVWTQSFALAKQVLCLRHKPEACRLFACAGL